MAVYNIVTGTVVQKGDSKKDITKCFLNIKAYDNSDFSLSILSVPKSADIDVGDEVQIRCTVRAFASPKGPRVCYFFDSVLKTVLLE